VRGVFRSLVDARESRQVSAKPGDWPRLWLGAFALSI
jgi:hypothetical protein